LSKVECDKLNVYIDSARTRYLCVVMLSLSKHLVGLRALFDKLRVTTTPRHFKTVLVRAESRTNSFL